VWGAQFVEDGGREDHRQLPLGERGALLAPQPSPLRPARLRWLARVGTERWLMVW
jgi:hypothetical protein